MGGQGRAWCVQAVLAGCIMAIGTSCASAAGWIRDIDQAMELAQARQQPVLLFISMDRCSYCQKMIQTTFADANVRQALGDGYIPAAMKAAERPDLIRRLKIRSFPTTLIVQPNGQIVDQMTGYQDIPTFQKHIKVHAKAAQPGEAIAAQPPTEQPPAPVRQARAAPETAPIQR